MNNIRIFQNEQFGQVRIAMNENGEPLFCLIDVCNMLDLIPSKVSQRLDKDVLSKYPLETAGGIQQTNFINEDGLYDVILDSRKPEAKQFRKWITSEVLPSIRKTGGYMISKPEDTPEELMARALLVAQDALRRREERIANLEQQTALQSEELQAAAPKVNYYEKVLQSTSTYNTNQIAKELGMSAVTLNQKLREMGVQYK